MKTVCETCNFDLWIPIKSLGVSTLGLYNDARFWGRCILTLNDHYEQMFEVPDDVLTQFALDAKRAMATIQEITGCERVNYAVLGNTEPHVHAHLIPRYSNDPVITRPPWEHPDPKTKRSADDVDEIVFMFQTLLV